MLGFRTYYTVAVPFVASPRATEWHPTTSEGPFSTLTRGAFPSVGEAVEWARSHLNGCPYTITRVDAEIT